MKPLAQSRLAAVSQAKTCVIVSGMHRSGTSATARVVNLLGADIARELMPAIAGDNDRGFWESKAVVDIHESLLAALGSAWDDPFPLPDHWLETDAARRAKRALADVLAKDFAQSRLFTVKDPRLARLLPLWLDLLDELGIEPVVIVAVRNPLEVAASLQRRDHFAPGKSMLLYLRHALDIELASRGRSRMFVRYDKLVDDWRPFARRFEAAARMPLPDRSAANADEIDRFLAPDLYRNRVDRRALAEAPDVPGAVIELFDRMSEASDTGDDAALRAACDRIRPKVDEATHMFGGLVPRARASGKKPPRQLSIADLISPASFWFPEHLCDSGWIEHAPFAYWLLDAHRPGTLVELGTHWGFSFFAFCQAVKALGLETKCVAIDSWHGDDHAGHYGEEVFDAVRRYNDSRYGDFATLVRSTFDAAAPAFADGSIDLLHVDGRHFYDDVRHDFDTWRPKLSRRGIVVFHDINVHERGFGVHRVWAELRKDYPHFEFPHGHGLGIIAVGQELEMRIRALFEAGADRNLRRYVRDAYARLGAAVNERLGGVNAHKVLAIKDEHIATHVAHIAAQTEALARFERELAAERDLTETLQGKVQAQHRKLDAQRAELDAQRAELDARQAELDARRVEFDAQRVELDAQRVQLDAQRVELDAQRAELDSQRVELDAQRVELDAIARSTSWRITRPLRLAGDALPLLLRRRRQSLP
jgi:hypothetical protein